MAPGCLTAAVGLPAALAWPTASAFTARGRRWRRRPAGGRTPHERRPVGAPARQGLGRTCPASGRRCRRLMHGGGAACVVPRPHTVRSAAVRRQWHVRRRRLGRISAQVGAVGERAWVCRRALSRPVAGVPVLTPEFVCRVVVGATCRLRVRARPGASFVLRRLGTGVVTLQRRPRAGTAKSVSGGATSPLRRCRVVGGACQTARNQRPGDTAFDCWVDR